MGETPKTPDLSIVIPVYNQGTFILSSLAALNDEFSDLRQKKSLEILLVDDGSTKDAELMSGADRLIRFKKNQGKGAAVKAGVLAAKGDVVAYTDADLSYSPEVLRELFLLVKAGAPAAFGVREVPASGSGKGTSRRSFGSRLMRGLTKRWLLKRETDTQCGVKAFSAAAARQIFEKLTVKRFAFDVEVYCLADILNIEVKQIPVEAKPRDGSSVRIISDGTGFIRDLRKIKKNLKKGVYGGGGGSKK